MVSGSITHATQLRVVAGPEAEILADEIRAVGDARLNDAIAMTMARHVRTEFDAQQQGPKDNMTEGMRVESAARRGAELAIEFMRKAERGEV